MKNSKLKGRIKRAIRIRSKIVGSAEKPRVSVFRSNRYIYAQIIDDLAGKTLAEASEKELKTKGDTKSTKSQRAKLVGELLAQKAGKVKVAKVVFDRHGYKYHGRVKILAEAARAGGLKF